MIIYVFLVACCAISSGWVSNDFKIFTLFTFPLYITSSKPCSKSQRFCPYHSALSHLLLLWRKIHVNFEKPKKWSVLHNLTLHLDSIGVIDLTFYNYRLNLFVFRVYYLICYTGIIFRKTELLRTTGWTSKAESEKMEHKSKKNPQDAVKVYLPSINNHFHLVIRDYRKYIFSYIEQLLFFYFEKKSPLEDHDFQPVRDPYWWRLLSFSDIKIYYLNSIIH